MIYGDGLNLFPTEKNIHLGYRVCCGAAGVNQLVKMAWFVDKEISELTYGL